MEKVSDFARRYGLQRNTVTSYVRRHPEIFKGHARKDGREVLLDEQGVIALEKAYCPQVIVDRVNAVKLEDASDQITALSTDKEKLMKEVIDYRAKYEAYKQLYEGLQDSLKTAENDRESARKEVVDIKVQYATQKVEMEHLQAEVERLKHRNLIQRMFNV